MPLEPVPDLLAAARSGGYALGYFESWNMESLCGVIDAAEATRSPVIVGFNGDLLSRPERRTEERVEWYGALGRAVAQSASVPCGLLFNECPSDAHIRASIRAGFNLAMLADSQASYDAYVQRLIVLTRLAHDHGVAMEAELGELPSGSSGRIDSAHSALTDVDLAARLVDETQVDVLNVSVGNVHVLLGGQRELDLEHLAKLRSRIDVPLGLHGGTGIAPDSLRKAVRLGVAKVAFGTYLKQRYLAAVRQSLADGGANPHRLLGMGEQEDVLVASRHAVRDAVLERLGVLGCCGKV
jgi:fructose/tagatose bisphosphate aldolase